VAFKRDEEQEVRTRDIVMMTELKDEAEVIEKYEYFHSKEGVWPEVIHAASSYRMPEWDSLMEDYMQGPPGAAAGTI